MKILLLTGDSSLTGAPLHVLQLATNFLKLKHDVMVISPPGKLINLCQEAKIDCHKIRMKGPFDWGAVRNIEKKLKEFKPDIAHFHGTRGGWLGRIACRKIDTKVIYTEHLWTENFRLKNLAYQNFQLRGLKFLDRYSDATIAVSKAVYDFLIKHGYDKNKIYIIPNGIPSRYVESKTIAKPKDVPFIVGTVGSLNYVKNHQGAIKAISIFLKNNPDANVHLQIVGDGPLKKSLQRLTRRTGISEKIQFTGRVEDVLERLQHFQIFLSLSLSESFGMAVGEAMAVGLPVIASNIKALRYLVDGAGILANPHDHKKVAKEIEKLYKDSKKQNKLGALSKKRIRENFSEEKLVQKTIELYTNLLKG